MRRVADDRTVTPERDAVLVDAMLGKLATYLRMCGYDAAYADDRGAEADDRLRTVAAAEGRRLLTRDRALGERTPGAVVLTERGIEGQLRELYDAGFALRLPDRPTRCGVCNGPVERLGDDDDRPDYAPDPGEEPVWRCRDCGRCFWRGSHWADVQATLREVRREARRDRE